MSGKSGRLVVDAGCGDQHCDHKGNYDIDVFCGNCRLDVTLRITRGHKVPTGFAEGPPCPNCGCQDWHQSWRPTMPPGVGPRAIPRPGVNYGD